MTSLFITIVCDPYYDACVALEFSELHLKLFFFFHRVTFFSCFMMYNEGLKGVGSF